jgi:cytochrome c553
MNKYRLSFGHTVVTLLFLGFSTLPHAAGDLSEFDEAIKLTPDPEKGRALYRTCATCHRPEGWGTPSGAYPQIAGQLPSVLIKQMADFRANNRDNPIMRAFASQRSLGGPQEIADVAAYVASLPMNPDHGRGVPINLELGAEIYERDCKECHGANGEGNQEDHVPKIQGQHYAYLKRQFDWIRNGRRRNADKKMVKQIRGFSSRDEVAVLSYVSHIPPEQTAKQNWRNPHFQQYDRSWRPAGR